MEFSENIITWNFANWMTIIIMALLGYFLFALLANTLNIAGEKANA